MTWTSIRLVGVSGLLVAVFLLTLFVRGGLTRDEILMPRQPVTDLPSELGSWHGEDVELDPKIAAATGADSLVNRMYAQEGLMPVSLHCAVHGNPETAVIHTPTHCYRSQAYQRLDERQIVIPGGKTASVEANLSTWKKGDRTVRVLYWFQWGEHAFFDRESLVPVRRQMAGLQQWPAVIKVLLETPATDDEQADEERLVSIGSATFAWLAANSGLPQPNAE